jgi:DNA repair protein RecN (Recombination protein N)
VVIAHKTSSGEPSESVVVADGVACSSDMRGVDLVEYYLSTNPGEEPKPLTKVASGGEVSRIMLALKLILAKVDRMPLMVFDEIDVGVSGRIAQRVGMSMKALGAQHQIIAITHLAQIAAFADAHFVVEKSVAGSMTSSSLRRLSAGEHVQEVARLISGADVSAASLVAAEELIMDSDATRHHTRRQVVA